MMHNVTDRYILSDDEKEIIVKATKILDKLSDELAVAPTYFIDNQEFDLEIENLIDTAILCENEKIFSWFNWMDETKRDNLMTDILRSLKERGDNNEGN